MNIALYAVCKKFVLPLKEKSVLLALTSYPGVNEFEAFPSVATLAQHTGMGTTAVKLALRSLMERKIITPQGKTKGGGHQPTRYLICPQNIFQPDTRPSGCEEFSPTVLTSSPTDGSRQPDTRPSTMGFKDKEKGKSTLPDSVSESWQVWLKTNVWDYYVELVEPGPYCFATIKRKKMLDARFREAMDSGATPKDAAIHMREAIAAFAADDYFMGRKNKKVCRKDIEEIFGTQETFQSWCSKYHHAAV